MSQILNLSIVIPIYNEDESIGELCTWIDDILNKTLLSYEIILVDDGSTDNSWACIQSIITENSHAKGIRFNRNYGKSAGLNTGFKHAAGEVVVTMDADLQDSPEELLELYRMITENGFDLVSGWKKIRYDPISKTIPSRFFNFITRLFSGIKLHDFNCGLKAYKLEVVKNIEIYGEMHRYIPFIAKWHGYNKIGEKIVEHRARKYGTTKFGLERFVFGFLDLLSIIFVFKFKKRPMHFFGSLGSVSFFIGLGITTWLIGFKIYNIYYHLPARDVVEQPLFFLALVALIIGVQLFLAGFLAEMMIQIGTKKEKYLISEKEKLS